MVGLLSWFCIVNMFWLFGCVSMVLIWFMLVILDL